jgi:hypothetical protein
MPPYSADSFFALAGEAYLTINVITSAFAVATINVLLVGGVNHFIWDQVCLLYLLCLRVAAVIQTGLSTSKLNDQVLQHREIIRAAKVKLLSERPDISVGSRALAFLTALDDLIETREEQADPHRSTFNLDP